MVSLSSRLLLLPPPPTPPTQHAATSRTIDNTRIAN